MPFEPAFMQRLPEFHAALAEVKTAEAWQAFKATWFADQPWPRRSPQALQALKPGETLTRGGRTFRRAPFPDDLGAEARYQYFAALQLGFAAVFPPSEAPGAPGVGVRFHCPACELWSDEPGGPACPECGRPLLRMRLSPPR
jgi:hypothetical protein